MKTLYVGNLPFSATETEIKELFSQYGEVPSVNIILDRQTGRSRGFAFVQMEDVAAQTAVEALNGQLFAGRRLQINEARPMEERPPREDRPYRPHREFRRDGEFGGDRPYRPRRDRDGEFGGRPYRPRRDRDGEFGGRPYRPRRDRDDEFGDRSYRPRHRDNGDESDFEN